MTVLIISSLNVCMVKKYILYFVVAPGNFVIANFQSVSPDLYQLYYDIISTDEDPGLQNKSFVIIKLCGVSPKYNINCINTLVYTMVNV